MRLNVRRIVLWLIVAPVGAAFCAAFALALAYWLFGYGAPSYRTWQFNPSPAPLVGVTIFYGLVAGALAVAANATIGTAWQITAHRLRLRALPTHLAAGVVSGFAFAAIITWNIHSNQRLDQLTEVMPLLNFGATIGGLTAWFAWLIRRPDRDAPNLPTSAS